MATALSDSPLSSGGKPGFVEPELGCRKKLADSAFVSVEVSQMLGLSRELVANLPL